MNKTNLKKFANLIAKVGANVQEGQYVEIYGNVNDEYFIKYVVEACYKLKAAHVFVDWDSTPCNLMQYKNESKETLGAVPKWQIERIKERVEKLPCRIYIDSEDPDAYNSVDQNKMMDVRRKRSKKFKKYSDQMESKYQWTIAAIPSESWAKKVFPGVSKKEAISKLWDAIFTTTRVDGDCCRNWDLHNEDLISRCNRLNEMKIKKLHYESSLGTNFDVELKECMKFSGGGDYTLSGIYFNPNMPTEECYTTPDKNSANGIVMASKPLSVMGTLVDNFGFEFKNGKVVRVIAKDEKDKALLEKLISLDEGASRLGEVALVPFDSPVNQTGVLFYNTLFDENACCHLAIGKGFVDCIRGFMELSEEQIKEVDINDSMIHEDFMIGTADLSIKAVGFDGKEYQIFENGTWAF